MTQPSLPKRGFFAKNIGPVERMIWALVGLALMSIGFLPYHALTTNGIGLVFVFIGFLVFLQAPMAWSLTNALRNRTTFERDVETEGEPVNEP